MRVCFVNDVLNCSSNFKKELLSRQLSFVFIFLFFFLFLVGGCTFPTQDARQLKLPHAEIVNEDKIPLWIKNYALIPKESILFSSLASDADVNTDIKKLEKHDKEKIDNNKTINQANTTEKKEKEPSATPEQFSLKTLLNERRLLSFYQTQAKTFGFKELIDFQAQEGHLLQFVKSDLSKTKKEILSIEIVSLPYAEHYIVRLGYSLAEHPTD